MFGATNPLGAKMPEVPKHIQAMHCSSERDGGNIIYSIYIIIYHYIYNIHVWVSPQLKDRDPNATGHWTISWLGVNPGALEPILKCIQGNLRPINKTNIGPWYSMVLWPIIRDDLSFFNDFPWPKKGLSTIHGLAQGWFHHDVVPVV